MKSDLNSLKKIVNNFVTKIPYQNFGIHLNRIKGKGNYVDLSIETLTQRLFIDNIGGMCYELSEIMYHILNDIGFEVKRIGVYPLNDKPYDSSIPTTHNILLIEINNNLFLVDVGYGYNTIRYPIKLDCSKIGSDSFNEIIFKNTNESYKIDYKKEYITLSQWENNKWFSLYRINIPLKFLNQEEAFKANIDLMNIPKTIPIRDQFLKIGIQTDLGKIGYNIKINPFEGFKIITKKGQQQIIKFNCINDINQNLFKELNLKIPYPIIQEIDLLIKALNSIIKIPYTNCR